MKETLFFHGKTDDGRRFTIAAKFEKNGLLKKSTFMNLGASMCSANDIFVKRVGRFKAEGRLSTRGTKGHIIVPVELKNDNEIETFTKYAAGFNDQTSKQFQKTFNLYHSNKSGK